MPDSQEQDLDDESKPDRMLLICGGMVLLVIVIKTLDALFGPFLPPL